MRKFPQNAHLLFINSASSSIFDENHSWFSSLRDALRASKLVLDSDLGFVPDEFLLRFSSLTRIFRGYLNVIFTLIV